MKNKYTLSEIVSTGYAFILTRLFFSQARLIRRPIYIRGRQSIKGAKGLTTGHFCRFDLDGRKKTLQIGKNCQIGDNVHIVAHEKVCIGDNVLMASKVFISDSSHGMYKGDYQSNPNEAPNERDLCTRPVFIGNNVWIGENVVILSGVKIGDNCIIGANSVVTKDISENIIAAGTPALPIKEWNSDSKKWELIRG